MTGTHALSTSHAGAAAQYEGDLEAACAAITHDDAHDVIAAVLRRDRIAASFTDLEVAAAWERIIVDQLETTDTLDE